MVLHDRAPRFSRVIFTRYLARIPRLGPAESNPWVLLTCLTLPQALAITYVIWRCASFEALFPITPRTARLNTMAIGSDCQWQRSGISGAPSRPMRNAFQSCCANIWAYRHLADSRAWLELLHDAADSGSTSPMATF